MPMIKELPEVERPREKMLEKGSEALSNTELIAILIGNGQKNESAMVLASKILSIRDDGINFLLTATPEELLNISGIGDAKACRIAAAVELGKRMSGGNGKTKPKFGSPEEIAALFMEEMRCETKEYFRILLLNTRNEMIGKELISIGNITSSIVDPRDVFKPAVKRGAASIVLIHNHPSGNPEPSDADLQVTNRLIKAGELLEIRVLDHLIIGDGKFVSFKKRKLI